MLFRKLPFPQWSIPSVYDGNITYMEQIGYLTASFNKLSTWVDETIQNLEDSLPSGIAAEITKQLQGIQTQINGINSRISGIDTQIRSMLKDINTIGLQTQENKKNIESLNEKLDDEIEKVYNDIDSLLNRLLGVINNVSEELQNDYYSKIKAEAVQRILEDDKLRKAIAEIKEAIYPPIFNLFRQHNTSIQDYTSDFYRFGRYGSMTCNQLLYSGITIGELDDLEMTAYEFDWFCKDFVSKWQTKNDKILSPITGQYDTLSHLLNELYGMSNQNSKYAGTITDISISELGDGMTMGEFSKSRNEQETQAPYDENLFYQDYQLVYESTETEQPFGFQIPVTADAVRIIHSGGTDGEYVADIEVTEGQTITLQGSDTSDNGLFFYTRKLEYGQYEESEMVMMNGFTLSDCKAFQTDTMDVSTANDNCVVKRVYARVRNQYQTPEVTP